MAQSITSHGGHQDFKLHFMVAQLLSLVDRDAEADTFVDILQAQLKKGGSSSSPTKVQTINNTAQAVATIAATLRGSPKVKDQFLTVYEEFKSHHPREVDAFMSILHKVYSDSMLENPVHTLLPQTPRFMKHHATESPIISRSAKSSAHHLPLSEISTPNSSSASLASATFVEMKKSRSFFDAHSSVSMSGTLNAVSLDGSTLTDKSAFAIPPTPKISFAGPASTGIKTMSATKEATATKSPFKASPLILGSDSAFPGDLAALPFSEQEQMLTEDLLYVLLGIEGVYIRRSNCAFQVDPTLNPSLKEMVKRILPIAENFLLVEDFTESHSAFEFGRVNHALCASFRSLLKEYLILIAQLEHQSRHVSNFGIQKLWFYLRPTAQVMSAMASVVEAILLSDRVIDARPKSLELVKGGGVLLSILSEKLTSFGGDPETKQVYEHLMSESITPYLKMLHSWIYHGEIDDPFDEFMIHERRSVNKDQLVDIFNDVYWEQRYTIKDEAVPTIFSEFQDKILLSGKYLNVLQECDPEYLQSETEDKEGLIASELSGGSLRFLEIIDGAYNKANSALLKHLFSKCNLGDRLRSLKHYFLLDQSDFIIHFMDIAGLELSKQADFVSIEKVDALLELVLRNPSSVSCLDPFKDDVKCEFSNSSLIEQLLRIGSVQGMDLMGMPHALKTGHDVAAAMNRAPLNGIQTFVLNYTVQFPLSLVINRKVIAKYQLLFRLLFQCKYVERLLSAVWLDQVKAYGAIPFKRQLDAKQSAEVQFMSRLCALRTKMLHFIQQFLYYVCFEVLEPNWMKLEELLGMAEGESSSETNISFDDLLHRHDDFLDTCLKESILTSPALASQFAKMMDLCTTFSHFSEWYTRFKIRSPAGAGSSFSDADIQPVFSLASHPSSLEAAFFMKDGSLPTPESANIHMTRLDSDFGVQMKELLNSLQFFSSTETAGIGNLIVRLDYNLYYTGI